MIRSNHNESERTRNVTCAHAEDPQLTPEMFAAVLERYADERARRPGVELCAILVSVPERGETFVTVAPKRLMLTLVRRLAGPDADEIARTLSAPDPAGSIWAIATDGANLATIRLPVSRGGVS